MHTNLRQESAQNVNSKSTLGSVLILALCAALSLMLISNGNPYYTEPGRDSGFFMFAGREMLKGKQLYTQIWDSKGPLIFFINAFGLWLGAGSRWGLWFLELILLTLGFGFAYSVINRHWGHLAGLFGIITGACALATIFGAGNTVEEYSLLFSLLSLYAYDQSFTRSDHRLTDLLIGACAMASFHLRANNIGVELVSIILIIIVIWREKGFKAIWTRIGWIFLGSLIVNIPVFLYFYLQGTLEEMLAASLVYNFSYSAVYGSSSFLSRIINDSLLPGLAYFKGWAYVFGLGYAASIYYAVRKHSPKPFDPFIKLNLVLLPVEVILSAVSGREFGHYFINWIPAIMLSAAILFIFAEEFILSQELVQALKTHAKTYATLFALILMLALQWDTIVLPQAKALYKFVRSPAQSMDYVSRTARYIQENTNPDDRVLVLGGQCGINLMSNRSSIDGALFYPLINNSPLGLKLQSEYFQNLKDQKPVYIVDGFALYPWHLPAIDPDNRAKQNITSPLSQNTEEVLSYIWEHYQAVYEVEGYTIYRINP